MLQEACDALVDNGRRGRAIAGTGNHRLKSLSDMLKGKQGRFRQNLLGKRVDYSGRSVIVVGPELKLHQCGLPKRMALELFKPFVMHSLVAKGLAHNIKSAKRIVERARPEVWDVLDEVIRDRPVLLNRAPTLHRLGIQAFQPILIEGSAIQLHPLVCSAFNADFDGDQMAVHVPLSREAVAEAKQILLSTRNLLSPASGNPIVAPSLDMVLGCYSNNGTPAEGMYSSFDEARLAFDLGNLELRAPIRARTDRPINVNGQVDYAEQNEDGNLKARLIDTTVGRIIFNSVLPPEVPFQNDTMDRPHLREVVASCYRDLGQDVTSEIVDSIKDIGFHYATRSGVTIAIHEIQVPKGKAEVLAEADARVDDLTEQYQMGLITEEERYQQVVEAWSQATERVEKQIKDRLREYGSLHYMASSGTKGNITQIRQMAGLRGLMADPNGRIIELPIRSSFREGLTVLEYFISTHGARKGLADTALRTADSGYLTRRLIDVAQDVIILEDDCGTTGGIWIERDERDDRALSERVVGRYAAIPVTDEKTGEILCDRDQELSEDVVREIESRGLRRVFVRTPMSCEAERGVCAPCYARLGAASSSSSGRPWASSPRSPSASQVLSSPCVPSTPAASPAPPTSPAVFPASKSFSRREPPRARPSSARSTASWKSSPRTIGALSASPTSILSLRTTRCRHGVSFSWKTAITSPQEPSSLPAPWPRPKAPSPSRSCPVSRALSGSPARTRSRSSTKSARSVSTPFRPHPASAWRTATTSTRARPSPMALATRSTSSPSRAATKCVSTWSTRSRMSTRPRA
jgi:DNA-directed RNA polymerase subunit beta'